MSFLDDHRRAVGEEREILLLEPPFSFFDLIETRFGDFDSIRRLFSLARSFSAETLIIEPLRPTGIIMEENEDIFARYPSYQNTGLLRLSFWKMTVWEDGVSALTNDDLVGYAIFKHDVISAMDFDRWHVFEAVFPKYSHEHNCVPRPGNYRLVVGGKSFEIAGLLYCQQNELNKACAQVALRSLLSRILPEGDISYRRINQIAETANPGFNPGKGLNVSQMRQVLSGLGIMFNDVDYSQGENQLRKDLPYQKYAYAGLESGCGALVGFRLAGPGLQEEGKHILPFRTFSRQRTNGLSGSLNGQLSKRSFFALWQ